MKAFNISGARRSLPACCGLIALLFSLMLTLFPVQPIRARGKLEDGAQAPQVVFSNPATISVSDAPSSNTPPGTAVLYPSTINVVGLGTSITSLSVTLSNVNHLFPPDFDLLLVGPGGQSLILQSDAGSSVSAVNRTYTFSDAAATQLANTGNLPSGSVRPGNHQGNDNLSDVFPSPAPPPPYGNPGPQGAGTATLSSTFNGTNPNGVWSLYVTDDEFLDTGNITGGWSLSLTATTPTTPLSRVSDYDGDNKTDLAVTRNFSGNATWYINGSAVGFFAQAWGRSFTDFAVPQDYDGDGKTDIAVWRMTDGNWYILQSQTSTLRIVNFGSNGDDPRIADDYDGDGKADPAVVRNGGGFKTWYYLGSTSGFAFKQWGLSTDSLAPGDYDGDGKTDFAVRRSNQAGPGPATFYIDGSATGFQSIGWGNDGDIIAPGDYDGDNKTDIAVAHPSGPDLFWYVRLSGGGIIENARWGFNSDLVTQGDYNGDNKTDLAVWRPSTGFFYITLTGGGGNIFTPWGQDGDSPPAHINTY